MTVKQISLITMKSGEKVNLPDSLNEAEICFTNDTGEVFIGAPNFGPVQYRSDQAASTNGQGISPYRNIKILTEFDVTQTITGDSYTQGPLVNLVLPLSETPSTLYTFEAGINSVIASLSLYDGVNVNMVADIYIATFGGQATVCMAGMKNPGIVFSAQLVNNSIVLEATNTTNSIYTMYMSARCWQSSLASWDGAKGQGSNPICYAGAGDGSGNGSGTGGGSGVGYLSKLLDVNLNTLQGGQFLKFDSSQNKWINASITYGDIGGDAPEGKTYLKDLLDVSLITDGSSTTLADGQALVYNASLSKWQNKNVTAKSISHTITTVAATGSSKSDAASTYGDILFVTIDNVARTNSISGSSPGTASGQTTIGYPANTNLFFDSTQLPAGYNGTPALANSSNNIIISNTQTLSFSGGSGTGAKVQCGLGIAIGITSINYFSSTTVTYRKGGQNLALGAATYTIYLVSNNLYFNGTSFPPDYTWGSINITCDSNGKVTGNSGVKLNGVFFNTMNSTSTGYFFNNLSSKTTVLDSSSGSMIIMLQDGSGNNVGYTISGLSLQVGFDIQYYLNSIGTVIDGGNNYTVGDTLYFPSNAQSYWQGARYNSLKVTTLSTVPTRGIIMPSPMYDGEILTIVNGTMRNFNIYQGDTPMDSGTVLNTSSKVNRFLYGGANNPTWYNIQQSW